METYYKSILSLKLLTISFFQLLYDEQQEQMDFVDPLWMRTQTFISDQYVAFLTNVC